MCMLGEEKCNEVYDWSRFEPTESTGLLLLNSLYSMFYLPRSS
jgi:hypothetical protein